MGWSINNVKHLAQTGWKVINQSSPTILTGMGAAGVVGTAIACGRDTLKADKILFEASDTMLFTSEEDFEKNKSAFKEGNDGYELKFFEKVKLTWKCYIPTALTATTSIICIIGGHKISLRRQAALASLLSITQLDLKEHKEKVAELFGKNKAQKVHDAVLQDRVTADHISGDAIDYIETGHGNTKCKDAYTGRYFKSDIEFLRKTENEMNKALLQCGGTMALNDIYHAIGLENIPSGDDLGWNIEGGFIEFGYTSCLARDGEPCLVLELHPKAKFNYY